MNNLAESYGDKLSILAFPCNQFGHQTNENNEEILNTLKYVRPGSGFEPADTITMFSKVDVNGFNAHPMFRRLRRSRQIPDDSDVCTKNNGVDDDEVLVLPRAGFGNTTVSLWTPVTRNDIAWNFEKFVLDKSGNVVKRYSRYYDTNSIAKDVDALL